MFALLKSLFTSDVSPDFPTTCTECDLPLNTDPRRYNGTSGYPDITEESAAFCSEDCRQASNSTGHLYPDGRNGQEPDNYSLPKRV